jgi:hypothetical protein
MKYPPAELPRIFYSPFGERRPGIMEWWKIGGKEDIAPILHHSNTPWQHFSAAL